ncbi:MAG: hypothetical protein AAFR44_15525, partial [Pseudomonadota bacterium]
MRGAAWALGLILAAVPLGTAWAEAPEVSLKPLARPVAVLSERSAPQEVLDSAAEAVARSLFAPAFASLRPLPRPARAAPAVAKPNEEPTPVQAAAAVAAPVQAAEPRVQRVRRQPSPPPEPTVVSSGPRDTDAEEAPARQAAARPAERPQGLRGLFRRAAQPAKRYPTKGSVCGVRSIRGTAIGAVPGRGACGIPE